ncbi:MAG: D-cysteine desulfhydrase family protein [Firmicutes bacterium]|nr:D-cysteine desulfhydrase family protein [Bacillota bacterium]MCL5038839.1 D-cysteine desulfhydrase family protein [Bacillota bacterium]
MRLAGFPRIRVANLPTPLEELRRFRQAIGGPRLFMKRDDNTGLALGGNKARKLEYLMADALEKQCDVVITTGGPQSNHARMVAALARQLGMEVILLLTGEEPKDWRGNLLLDHILGAQVIFAGTKDYDIVHPRMEAMAEELRRQGRRPYVIPVGGATPLGSLGYVQAILELMGQATDRGVNFDYIVSATGSGGTMSGMLVGARIFAPNLKVVGISVSRDRVSLTQRLCSISEAAASLLGVELKFPAEEIDVFDQYIGEAYGIPTPEGLEAIKLLAKTEGILLDPVYTGKAMAGYIDLVKKGYFPEKANLVFFHTGGAPALFAMEEYFR